MFQRFTGRARQVVVLAQREAHALQHGHIGTEHLLLGVLGAGGVGAGALERLGVEHDAVRAALPAGDGLDADALATVGIDLDAVRASVEERFGPGALSRGRCRRGGVGRAMPFAAEAKRVLELALREALAMHDGFIGDEHIAIALAHAKGGPASETLAAAGITPAAVRGAVAAQRRLAS